MWQERNNGRTHTRAKGALRRHRRGRQAVFLVRLRAQRQPALLRRLTPGDRSYPRAVHRRGDRRGLAVRLQVHRRQAVLRRYPREPVRRPRAAPSAVLICLLALSGCGWIGSSSASKSSEACPGTVILRPLANTAVFGPAPERRPDNVSFYGLLSEAEAKCMYSGDAMRLILDVVVVAERGPAAKRAPISTSSSAFSKAPRWSTSTRSSAGGDRFRSPLPTTLTAAAAACRGVDPRQGNSLTMRTRLSEMRPSCMLSDHRMRQSGASFTPAKFPAARGNSGRKLARMPENAAFIVKISAISNCYNQEVGAHPSTSEGGSRES